MAASDVELDRAVRIAVYAEIVKTSLAPELTRLAILVGCSLSEGEASLQRLANAHILVLDENSQVRMAMPFSAVATSFRVTTTSGSWYANCAWDALGIPAALGADAQISTRCGDCAETMSFEVRSGHLVDDTGMIHFAVPAAKWWDDIRYT